MQIRYICHKAVTLKNNDTPDWNTLDKKKGHFCTTFSCKFMEIVIDNNRQSH